MHKTLSSTGTSICGGEGEGTELWEKVHCRQCLLDACCACAYTALEICADELDRHTLADVFNPVGAGLTLWRVEDKKVSAGWRVKPPQFNMSLPGAYVGDIIVGRTDSGRWLVYTVVEPPRPF